MTLKTLKDLEHNWNGHADEFIEELKEEAIKWIKEINKKSKAHWKELDEKKYTEMDEPFSWELDGLTFHDWHEAADPSAAIMILKHIFNITKDDLE